MVFKRYFDKKFNILICYLLKLMFLIKFYLFLVQYSFMFIS